MSDAKNNPGYVSRNYLQVVGDWFADIKQLTYKQMHIAYGHGVLDVGSGLGSDTLALSEFVGPQGRVFGVDYDKEMVQVADEKAAEAEVSDYVKHHVANAEDLPFYDETFHSCRSERVFQHLENPDKVLAEMVRVTKAGGHVVVADSDWSMNTIDIPYNDLEWKFRRLMLEDTRHGMIGRQLYRMMKRAGLTEINVIPRPLICTEYEFWKMITSFDDKVVPRGIKRGIWSAAEVAEFDKYLTERDKQNEFFAMITLMIVSGQKPE